MGNTIDRMQKKVDKRQKYYDKLKKQIERQANCYKNSMNMQISNMFGLGTNSVNLMSPYGSNGAAQSILNSMSDEQIQDIIKRSSNGKCDGSNFTKNEFDLIRSGGVTQIQTAVPGKYEKGDIVNNWTGDKVTLSPGVETTTINQAYSALQQFAHMQVSQMQTNAQNMKAAYENNVSIWQEAQLEQLEAQEEWEMDLLSEEQSDLEAEKTSIEAQLQLAEERKKAIEQQLGQSIQDSAPKFGLA